MNKNRILLGAHLSIAGGYEQAIIKGVSIGCTAVQIFTKSSRQWAAKPITQEQALLFKHTLKNNPTLALVLAHASYLINIASSNELLAKKSVTALIEELERCSLLSIPYLILHPGAYDQSAITEGLTRISENINYALAHTPATTMILLENTAGQGSSLGRTFEQLRTIFDGVHDKKRVGFCFDTCHAFAAGYNFSSEKNYTRLWQDFDDILGLENLQAFHMNDSVKECGSHVDRHAHIGHGKIGIEAFSLLMNDQRFVTVPKILETPKSSTDLIDDSKNMEILKSLLETSKE